MARFEYEIPTDVLGLKWKLKITELSHSYSLYAGGYYIHFVKCAGRILGLDTNGKTKIAINFNLNKNHDRKKYNIEFPDARYYDDYSSMVSYNELSDEDKFKMAKTIKVHLVPKIKKVLLDTIIHNLKKDLS